MKTISRGQKVGRGKYKKSLRPGGKKFWSKKPRTKIVQISRRESAKKFSAELLASQTKRFVVVLAGCLTKCGNKRRAANLVNQMVTSYNSATKQHGTTPFFKLLQLIIPSIKNRKQHLGRKLHFIPLPFRPKEQVKAPVKLAVHWFYQSLLKNKAATKLPDRLIQELQSIEAGTSEILKKKLATYRIAVESKASIRFYRFLKKI